MSTLTPNWLCRTNPTIQETWGQLLLLSSCDFVIIKSFQRGEVFGLDSLLVLKFCSSVELLHRFKENLPSSLRISFQPRIQTSLPTSRKDLTHVHGLTHYTLTIALWAAAFHIYCRTGCLVQAAWAYGDMWRNVLSLEVKPWASSWEGAGAGRRQPSLGEAGQQHQWAEYHT